MNITITTSQAADMLRADENASWSYSAAHAIANYFEELQDLCAAGNEVEFCPVAIRCEFSEYASAVEAAQQYAYCPDLEIGNRNRDSEAIASEWLSDNTVLLEADSGAVVIVDF